MLVVRESDRCSSDFVSFSAGDNLLLISPSLDGNEALLLAFVKNSADVGDNVLKMRLSGQVVVFLHFTFSGEQLEHAIIDAEAVVFDLNDNGSLDHISSSESLFVLFVREDVLASDHGFGRSVLAGLGSGEASDSAGEGVLEHDEGARLHAASFLKFGGEGTRHTLFKIVITHSLIRGKYCL